ncbi:MAG: hypothetical protein QOD24_2445 [Solirubrobacteraceae bacterium]|jgi:hypothetical protein|nr:hypothetical protein [Solirubrobacteraceae bacterium]
MSSGVKMPRGAEPPYDVFVNGVEQKPGDDYVVEGDRLVFSRSLEKEGKLGFWRWLSMALSIAGSYGRNDSVDLHYTLGGRRQVAVGLDIEPLNSPDDANRSDPR